MEPKKRKTSADFPQFQFRITETDKDEIQSRVDTLVKIINSKLSNDHRPFRKNEIIIEALKRGLSLLEAENKK